LKENVKQWTWNDGWILMSVYLVHSNTDSTLADVIGAADATNHAIPTPNELSQTFTKLVNAGILTIEQSRYEIVSEYLSEIERAYRSKGGLLESANKGQKWLNATSLEVNGSPKVTITQDELKNAYTEYTSKIKQKG
jgi:hypothetical protein